MRSTRILMSSLLGLGLMLALGQTAEPQATQQRQATWGDPRLDDVEELAMVRIAHLSPNAGAVEIALSWGDGEWTTAQAVGGQQQQQQAQETQGQEAGQGNLEVNVEPEDAVVAIAGPQQYAGQFSGSQTLSNLPAGTYAITVTRLGYETVSEEVEIVEGETATLEISLVEAEGEEAERQRQEEQPEPEEPTLGVDPPDAQPVEPRERPDLASMNYGDISLYLVVPAGEHQVTIRPAAQGQQQEFGAFETTVNFSAGGYYTLAAIGFVGTEGIQAQEDEGFFGWLRGLFGGEDPEGLELRTEVFEDNLGNLPAAGHALVRVIHASPGTGEIELRAWRGTAEGQTQQQQTARDFDETRDHAFGAVSYGQAGDYEEVRADRRGYNLEIRLADAEAAAAPALSAATIEPGAIYTVFVGGTQFADYPIEAIVTVDARVVGERDDMARGQETTPEDEGTTN